MLFGIECEVDNGGHALFPILNRDMGGVMGNRMHDYHCGCDVCSHSPHRANAWTMQEDCTVSGEVISRPLEWGSTAANDAIVTLAEAMREARSTPGQRAGNHVHVEAKEFYRVTSTGPYGRSMAPVAVRWHRLQRLFLRYQGEELEAVARASDGDVRGYNSRCAPGTAGSYYGRACSPGPETEAWWRTTGQTLGSQDVRQMLAGSWLAMTKRTETFEFRLWNSTRVEWRLYLHAGLSVAMMRAAIGGEWVSQHDKRTLAHVLAPYMDDRTAELLNRQLRFADHPNAK